MSYLIAAYGITGLVLVGYVLMLHRERLRLDRDASPQGSSGGQRLSGSRHPLSGNGP